MAKKEVTVVINGEEYVSDAARKAGDGLEGFGKKSLSASAIAARAAGVYYAIAEGIRMIGDKISASLKAYDEMNASQRKLEGTAKLLGVSQEYLNDIISEGQTKFQLSRKVATEYAIEVAKLAINSGNASSATELLASFLDLGAARGLTASESLQKAALSIVGIDEGTDALFGKNPSALFDDFAKVIGRSAGKFDDQDKAAALAFATLAAGIKVGGSYQAYLESAAGKQDIVNQRMLEAEASFGAALQPVRMLTLELGTSLMPALGPLARILGGMLAAAVVTVTKVFNILYGTIGLTVEGLGKLTGNNAMQEWGKNAVASANALGTKLNEAGEAAGRAIRGVDDAAKTSHAEQKVVESKRAEAVEAMAKLVADAKKREGASHKDATKEADKAFRDYIQAARDTFEMLNKAVISNEEVLKRLSPQLQKTYDRIHIDNARQATDALRQATDEHVKQTFSGIELSVSTWDRLRNKIREAGFSVENAARYTIDFAQSFGVLDRDAASALTSVVNIGSAVQKMVGPAGLSFAGVTGVLSGVANIVSTMMAGDTERRRLLAQNNTALDRLRKDIGGLNLRISGDTLVSAQTALAGVIGNLKGGRGAANENDVRNALYAQGLSMEDFDRIAKEFGIEVRTKSGALNVDSVKAVFEAIKTVQLGKVGSDFQSQLDFFTQGQDIGNEQGAGRAMNLLRFLQDKGGVGALAGLDLTDPAKLREQLIALRGQLNSAQGIDESQLGKLSGGQFNDLLVSLLGMLNTGTPTGGGGDVTVPTGGGGGTTSVPSETIQSVIKAMDNNLASILTSHTVIHERIAIATESSALSLTSIDAKMDTLIAVSAGTDRIDAALEAERRLLAVQQGTPVTF